MKRKTTAAIIATILILGISSAIAGYDYWYQHRPIDTSWVPTINGMLQSYSPITNASLDQVTISWYRLYSNENGTSQLIQYGNVLDALAQNLYDLTKKATIQLESSISFDFVKNITSSDKVVSLYFRESLPGAPRNFENYFILDDVLNLGLAGKIIELRVPDQEYSVWAIPK